MSADRAATILARHSAAQQSFLSRASGGSTPKALEHHPSAEGWSPAQIGAHVAMANEVDGRGSFWVRRRSHSPPRQASPSRAASSRGSGVPWNVKAFPLRPPDVIGLDDAVGAAARERARASPEAIASLTAERGSGYTIALARRHAVAVRAGGIHRGARGPALGAAGTDNRCAKLELRRKNYEGLCAQSFGTALT